LFSRAGTFERSLGGSGSAVSEVVGVFPSPDVSRPTWPQQEGRDARSGQNHVDDDKNEDDGGHYLDKTAQTIRPNRHALLSV
jgi:hypothetical protein